MWSGIKSILKGNDKCIIIEEGKPSYVILPFAEYQQLQKMSEGNTIEQNSRKGAGVHEVEGEEAANQEIEAFRETNDTEEEEEENSFRGTIRIEDLPF